MPAPPAAASGPSTVHPDRAVPRSDRPPAAPPHPSICPPIPVPRHPIVVRAGGNRDDLDLRGWWSLRRHGTYGRRIGVRRSNDRCLSACRDGLRSVSGRVLVTRHVHHPALHAAGQGHDNTGEQYQQTKFVGLHKSASQASLLDAPWLIMVSTFSRISRFGHHFRCTKQKVHVGWRARVRNRRPMKAALSRLMAGWLTLPAPRLRRASQEKIQRIERGRFVFPHFGEEEFATAWELNYGQVKRSINFSASSGKTRC